MAKSTKELLKEITTEAAQSRNDTGSVKHGLRRKGEETASEVEETEQDIETLDESDEEEEVDETASEDTEEETEEEESEQEEETEEEEAEVDTRHGSRENALLRINKKQEREISELRELVGKYETTKKESEQKEIGEEIKELALGLKLDPEGLTKIFNTFETIVERKISKRLPSEDLTKDYEEREENKYFDSEWNDNKVQTYLTRTYPKATAVQLREAKSLLDEISHDPDMGGRVIKGTDGKERLAGYPLEYLLWNHKSEFDTILNAKKKHGLESAGRAGFDDVGDEGDTSSSKGIDALDKKYRNIETDSTGLRRIRPRDRSI